MIQDPWSSAEPQAGALHHDGYRIVLASQSPRRRQMVTWLGVRVHATAVDIAELPRPGEQPAELAVRLALEKLQAVLLVPPSQPSLIIAADTVVDLAGQALGKPDTPGEAAAMLRSLRAGPHAVHTAISAQRVESAQAAGDRCTIVRRVTTRVLMRDYADEEIAAYVDGGDPMDKAGAYAIQHPGFRPVDQVERCYANVVGLPLCALAAVLRELAVPLEVDLCTLCLERFAYRCPGSDVGQRIEVP